MTKTYRGEGMTVQFDAQRCIHAAECVRRLPAVFDTQKRPWVQPANAENDAVAEVVMRCPTGALQFARQDGGEEEPTPQENSLTPVANGPLYVSGDVVLQLDGDVQHETRVALCRCGGSSNMPFCDNSHRELGFEGSVDFDGVIDSAETNGPLTITPLADGPNLLQGGYVIKNDAGDVIHQAKSAALCRCGASANKPFCDGAHTQINFSTTD